MKKKRKWPVIAACVVIAGAAAGAMLTLGKQSQAAMYKEVQVTQGDLTTYYHFDGLVHAPHVQTLTAREQDTVRTVYVQQNETVKKDQRLYKTEGGTVVTAGMDGEVTGLYIREGDVLEAGDKTVQIIDMERLEVQLNVDEYDVAAVLPGMRADVTVLALDETIEAFVTALDKNGTASGDLSYYTATMALQAPEGMYPGMQVSARMLRSRAENALLLKADAIRFDEYNKPYVLMRTADGKGTQQIPVSVGASDGIYAEILDGVHAGDTVLVSAGLSMAQLMEQMSAGNR